MFLALASRYSYLVIRYTTEPPFTRMSTKGINPWGYKMSEPSCQLEAEEAEAENFDDL